MPQGNKEISSQEAARARRQFIKKMKRDGKFLGTITVTEMVGQKDVESFIRMVLDAQESSKHMPSDTRYKGSRIAA